MPSDITRTSDDVRQGYGPPVMQQGRVILDRDFNALADTLSAGITADARDIIGRCGTPDNGFEISLEAASPPAELWTPVLGNDSPPSSPPDFYVGPGTMYVGGQRTVLPARVPGQAGWVFYSYFDQPDWRHPWAPETAANQEAVSLVLREQEVSAVEDPDLLDVALGGPDTTQRLRLMRRIERNPGNTCSAAAVSWLTRGFAFEQKTMRLLPQALLQVVIPPPQNQNPCDPVVSGGYLGAYNQLIRLDLRSESSAGAASRGILVWGYDNASFLYRVTLTDSTRQTLQLAQAPVDAFHQPGLNQVVEVLRMAAVLAEDENVANASQPIVRCVAEAKGLISTIATAYQSDQSGQSGGTVGLNQALPADYANDDFLFLRVWENTIDIDLTSNSLIGLSDHLGQSTGLQIQLSVPPDAQTKNVLPDGAYWLVAARPSTPQGVYPERFLDAPQPPDGPRQWLCPLAWVDWSANVVHDCREKFSNLVCLTKRERACCCTVTVGDGVNTFGDFTSINAALASLPPDGGEVCVLAGRYFEAVTISQSNVIIKGCGGETRIASPSLASPPGSNAGTVIAIAGAQHVELRSLVIEADSGDTGVSVTTAGSAQPADIRLCQVIVATTDQPAIAAFANGTTVEDCIVAVIGNLTGFPVVYLQGEQIRFTNNWIGLLSAATLPPLVSADIGNPANSPGFTGGLQIGAPSQDVLISGNEIAGGSGDGIILGSLQRVNEQEVIADRLDDIVIQRNIISDMGQCGIGPVALFDLTKQFFVDSLVEILSIANLFIEGNQISNCPRLSFQSAANRIALAAICLPDVANVVIRDNEIVNSGAVSGQAVSGIYVYHSEQAEISRNQILDARSSNVTGTNPPMAAAIFIQVITPPVAATDARVFENGVPALCLHDNVVSVPAGLALYVVGFGSFSICGNQFATARILSSGDAVLPAAGIYIVNTGSCLDALRLYLDVIAELDAALAPVISNPELDLAVSEILTLLLLWLTIVKLQQMAEAAKLNLAQLSSWYSAMAGTVGTGPGPVIFSHNRVSVSSGAKVSTARAATNVYVATFDDVAFQDNQCYVNVPPGLIICDAFLFGFTARVAGNRFQEGFFNVGLSCFAVGLLANISSLNIAPSGMYSSLGLQSVNTGNLPPSF